MGEGEYVDSLVNEYATLLRGGMSEDPQKHFDETGLVEGLSASADWTAQGARELVRLVDDYGAFMLRNALAIAIVLRKEDGTQGF
jgi:hypothetical protein